MPGKMTKSILRPPFRPPRYRQPSAARVYLAGRSEKRKIFTSAPESSGESRLRGGQKRLAPARSFIFGTTMRAKCSALRYMLPKSIGQFQK
jgi:hypothetical protein